MLKTNKPGAPFDQFIGAVHFHHMQLSSMADVKANILLTMSSLMMTLCLPQAMRYSHFWPLYILMASCLATICLAAYAVMPKLPPLTQTPPDTSDPNFDILFFGDFSRLSQEQFESSMEQILNDPSQAYSAQVREIYLLGKFLARKKYRFLRLGYVTFITGLCASFAGFIIESALQKIPL